MPFQTTNPPGARTLLAEGGEWTYVDVRTPEEFEEGHVPGAASVPLALRSPGGGMASNETFLETMKQRFALDAKLLVGCAAGGRSSRACEILAAAGFQVLVNVHGGFSGARDPSGRVLEPGWVACGFPIEVGPEGSG